MHHRSSPRILHLLAIIAILALALAACAQPQPAGPTATPEPSATPEPTAVPPMPLVFVSTRDGNNEIYVIPAAGGEPVRLTNDPGSDALPSISPDGKLVVFISNRDGNNEVYRMKIDGGEITRLTNTPEMESAPCWSPDGKQIVYQRLVGQNGDLFLMDADGANSRNLTNTERPEWSAAWSPDGQALVFSAWGEDGAQIFRMGIDGSGQQQLTHEKGFAWSPVWSPDGKTLLFVSIPQPPEGLSGLFIVENGKTYATTGSVFDMTPVVVAVYRAGADGSSPAALSGLPNDNWSPAFSSDGQTLYFAHDEAGNIEFYSLALSGGQPVNLSNNPAADHSPVQPFIPTAP